MTKEGQDGGETFVLAGGVTGTCCDDWTQGYTNYRNRDPADLIERKTYLHKYFSTISALKRRPT
jgi:hypothetical protein